MVRSTGINIRAQALLPIIMLAFLAVPSGVPVQAGDVSFWDHNGSQMRIEQHGRDVTISYEEPRRGIAKLGVASGDTLFFGKVSPNGSLTGEAFVFRRGCEPESYTVTGRWDPDGGQQNLTLRGAAPVRARGGCDIVDYSNSKGSATLRFALIGRDGHAGRGDDYEGQYEDSDEETDGGAVSIGHEPPGFNCAPYLRSGKCPEVTICRSPLLSSQDAMMGRLYKDLLRLSRNNRERRDVRTEQKSNLRYRNECGCDTACLEQAYSIINKSMGKQTVIWGNR